MNYRIFIGGIGVVAFLLTGCFQNTSSPIAQKVSTDKTGCPTVEDPVCGTDGVTYKNFCVAELSGATIDRPGTCSTQTIMSDVERKYLFWILRKRDNLKLASVPVRHVETQTLACDDCYILFYSWDDGRTTARIETKDEAVVSAIDSTGYDYVRLEQKEPVEFTDLTS